jgi:hypothetical protein
MRGVFPSQPIYLGQPSHMELPGAVGLSSRTLEEAGEFRGYLELEAKRNPKLEPIRPPAPKSAALHDAGRWLL